MYGPNGKNRDALELQVRPHVTSTPYTTMPPLDSGTTHKTARHYMEGREYVGPHHRKGKRSGTPLLGEIDRTGCRLHQKWAKITPVTRRQATVASSDQILSSAAPCPPQPPESRDLTCALIYATVVFVSRCARNLLCQEPTRRPLDDIERNVGNIMIALADSLNQCLCRSRRLFCIVRQPHGTGLLQDTGTFTLPWHSRLHAL